MLCPKAVIFDLDNTLAEAFQPPEKPMLDRFERLVPLVPTAIMSAASLDRIEKDLLAHMSPRFDRSELTLFTANAAQCYLWRTAAWEVQYEFGFTDDERVTIRTALSHAVAETGVLDNSTKYGDQFVDYEGYIAFTALGLGAPSAERKAWDPTSEKRQHLRSVLLEKLPQFDVYIGGATSVDITPKGINKAYGIEWHAKHLSLAPRDMLYIGDALYPGGNDEVVIKTGVQTHAVANPTETQLVVDELLASCAV